MLRRRELMAQRKETSVLPLGWKECKRIYTKSQSSYINTNFIATGDTTFKGKFSFENINGYFFGADSGKGTKMYGIQWSRTTLFPGYGSTRNQTNIQFGKGVFDAGDVMVLDLCRNDWKIYRGDTLIYSKDWGYQDFRCDYPLYLFSECRNGEKHGGAIGVSFYGGEIFDGDVLVHKYIPCVDDSGAGCLFDSVTKTPYYDAASIGFDYELIDGTYVALV